jgi:multidrug efflux pump subunit AcrA (membrane-fusion protein)
VAALEKDLEHVNGFELTVPAPCAGTVLRLRANAPGAFVQEGEVLSEVACAGQRLQAELSVPQSGVPQVKAGQGVKLRYDAFPCQRYGVRYGTVRWIGPAGGAADNAAAFRAIIDLSEQAITLSGQPRALLPGMGGRADIVVDRRSLASYAFEPIRVLRESLAEVPADARRQQ